MNENDSGGVAGLSHCILLFQIDYICIGLTAALADGTFILGIYNTILIPAGKYVNGRIVSLDPTTTHEL